MAKYVSSSLSSEVELLFVDLDQDPPKMITLDDKNLLGMQLMSIQKLFSLYFPLEGARNDLLPPDRTELQADSKSLSEPIDSQSSLLKDLSSCMHDTEVTVPTING
ncbi:salt tolerance-like protein [Hibiscus syriacus]|uniref:Salt tolerance-like protein n=2 Tax=Hibiscus syriacus TaxID=106335 RepID=A0A6A3BNZ2_HIBSY|nr:salt tolerance-like protein [Hibiscus syriacus]